MSKLESRELRNDNKKIYAVEFLKKKTKKKVINFVMTLKTHMCWVQ